MTATRSLGVERARDCDGNISWLSPSNFSQRHACGVLGVWEGNSMSDISNYCDVSVWVFIQIVGDRKRTTLHASKLPTRGTGTDRWIGHATEPFGMSKRHNLKSGRSILGHIPADPTFVVLNFLCLGGCTSRRSTKYCPICHEIICTADDVRVVSVVDWVDSKFSIVHPSSLYTVDSPWHQSIKTGYEI